MKLSSLRVLLIAAGLLLASTYLGREALAALILLAALYALCVFAWAAFWLAVFGWRERR